jgi:C4-dicarboxylate-specific signal transduction histidine kinase
LSLVGEQLRLRQIEVVLRLPAAGAGPSVVGNAIQLEQVFINVLANARDALAPMPSRRIEISCQLVHDTVELRFADSGPGIPPGLEQRIFDPFFTTKEVGKGTGLGLSITYGIIKEHRGTISVRNLPGAGAEFVLQLPLAKPEDLVGSVIQ